MTLTLWTYRRFIFINALADLRHRFSGSAAGYLWNVFIPLAQIAVFAGIFGVAFGRRMPDGDHAYGKISFIVFLCSGLLPWNAFAETLVRNASCLVGNAGFLRKLPLPEEIFVAKESMTGFLQTILTLGLFTLFVLCTGSGWHWQWLQALPLLVLFVSFAYGLGLILSCLNVFIRDIQAFMNVLMLLWFWLTPICYVESDFNAPGHRLILAVLHANPVYHFINGFQAAIFQVRWLTFGTWLNCLCWTTGANLLAIPVLRSLRTEIRDVL